MKWFDAGTKKMSVSTFCNFIKLIKLHSTATWVSPRDRCWHVYIYHLWAQCTSSESVMHLQCLFYSVSLNVSRGDQFCAYDSVQSDTLQVSVVLLVLLTCPFESLGLNSPVSFRLLRPCISRLLLPACWLRLCTKIRWRHYLLYKTWARNLFWWFDPLLLWHGFDPWPRPWRRALQLSWACIGWLCSWWITNQFHTQITFHQVNCCCQSSDLHSSWLFELAQCLLLHRDTPDSGAPIQGPAWRFPLLYSNEIRLHLAGTLWNPSAPEKSACDPS